MFNFCKRENQIILDPCRGLIRIIFLNQIFSAPKHLRQGVVFGSQSNKFINPLQEFISFHGFDFYKDLTSPGSKTS
jgi:hypothetical protein